MRLSSLIVPALDSAHLKFPGADGYVSAFQVLDRSQGVVGGVEASTITAILTNDEASVGLILSSCASGLRLVSIPLPARGESTQSYRKLLLSVLARETSTVIVARDDIAQLLEQIGVPCLPHSKLGMRPIARQGSEFALVQYSSGSTGVPRSILLSDEAVGANVYSIISAVRPTNGEVAVSWLPLSHDMGLIGLLLTTIASAGPLFAGQTSLVLLSTEDFVRHPERWLKVMSDEGGTFTAAPDFGYRMALRGPPCDHDLSSVRVAIVGGEIVRHRTLTELEAAFAPCGWRDTALSPAYGMAEIGLCATLTPPEVPWREGSLTGDLHGGERSLVSSGPPIDGVQLRIDPSGVISVRSPSTGLDAASGQGLADPDGWMLTEDVGRLSAEGWLTVGGRRSDYASIRGRNLLLPPIEDRLGQLPGVRRGRVAVWVFPDGEVTVFAEVLDPTGGLHAVTSALREGFMAQTGMQPDTVRLVSSGSMPYTPSGKLQRHLVPAIPGTLLCG